MFYENINGNWIKYSDYTITGDSPPLIVPSKGARPMCYDAIEKRGDIIRDALMAGRAISENPGSMENTQTQVLEFVKQYGLLGFLTYLPLNPSMVFDDEVFLGKNNHYLGANSLKTDEYISVFYPLKQKGNEKFSVMTGCGAANDYTFDKNYGEFVIWIGAALLSFYKNYQSFYSEGSHKKSPAVTVLENSCFTFSLEGYKSPKMLWQPNSLFAMLELFFSDAFSDKEKPVKICKKCSSIFYSENKRSEFCSAKCRNQYNVYKSRSRD